ncbi:MAG: radical SAM protein, partial [Thermodesulfobacteriota bacterium]|nr:radical SAM protein [Thermodesulfobacteriota bacterium]
MVYEREMSKFFDATSRHMTYELGPSRPPSEATSLLIRLVRGCPWHRCSFCSSHRTKAFSLRSVEEVKRDIETAKKVHDKIKELSWQLGERGNDRKIAALVYSDPPNENFRNVALWLYHGAQTCFLQDADSLVLKTPQLVEIIRFLKETFPSITRVTSYARSKTASKKKLEEFIGLHEVGLSRLHIGFESGSDEVLEFVEKGVSASEHITAGKRIVESGISLCLYLMPGLGGRHKSNIHMEESAKAINEINPHYIRLRSLMLR